MQDSNSQSNNKQKHRKERDIDEELAIMRESMKKENAMLRKMSASFEALEKRIIKSKKKK